MLARLYRRIVVRKFGGLRNLCVWLASVVVTIYLLDSYVFPKHQATFGLDHRPPTAREVVKPKDPLPVETKPEEKTEKKPDVKPVEKPDNKIVEKSDEKPIVKLEIKSEVKTDYKPAIKSLRIGSTCLIQCAPGQISYYLKSGKDRDISPVICFDGNYVMSEKQNPGKRGLNVVVINNETFAVEDSRVFDIYQSDELMIRYLKLGVEDGRYILAATLDDASYHLSDDGRNTLKRYGSSLISKLAFRDNFIMIGQRGLSEGSAVEKHLAKKEGSEFSDVVEMSGCVNIPIGKVDRYVISDQEREILSGGPKLGVDKPNCGVKSSCDSGSFSVHMFTGIENKYMAKVCVNGKYIFGEGLNDAGRGLNIAVVNTQSKEVVRVGRFDTFGADSSNLEIFIEMLSDNEIVIVVSYDEATKNFDLPSQKLFQALGSSYANKLTFRDAWVFVGQQGMTGYSPIEELSPANDGWPKPIDKVLCVPTTLKGSTLPLADPPRITKPA